MSKSTDTDPPKLGSIAKNILTMPAVQQVLSKGLSRLINRRKKGVGQNVTPDLPADGDAPVLPATDNLSDATSTLEPKAMQWIRFLITLLTSLLALIKAAQEYGLFGDL